MILNWGLIGLGFSMGTFKFLFAHWIAYAAADATFFDLTQIFISTTLGAWITMTVFYWMSEYFMKRARIKRIAEGKKRKTIISKPIKKWSKRWLGWRIKRGTIFVKNGLGVYGITFLAPLFLSIPGGAVVCAKFFGHKKITFPLMLLNTAIYSVLMCSWIYATQ